MERDFTYVDDIVAGVVAALDQPARVDPAWDALRPDPSTSGVARGASSTSGPAAASR
jgi:UDP-glucuronate 4-epimerase